MSNVSVNVALEYTEADYVNVQLTGYAYLQTELAPHNLKWMKNRQQVTQILKIWHLSVCCFENELARDFEAASTDLESLK